MTLSEKCERIKKAVSGSDLKNPVKIAENVMREDYVSMHGPEHHFLDGAAFLAAYKNAGGNIDLAVCLDELEKRTELMPGAMCGLWGVCGSAAAVGAALSVIHGTGPLSTDEFYKDHMEFTSKVIGKMSKIGGARCCKRNAFLSLSTAAEYVREKYGVAMETEKPRCTFSEKNRQCLGGRCPFFAENVQRGVKV